MVCGSILRMFDGLFNMFDGLFNMFDGLFNMFDGLFNMFDDLFNMFDDLFNMFDGLFNMFDGLFNMFDGALRMSDGAFPAHGAIPLKGKNLSPTRGNFPSTGRILSAVTSWLTILYGGGKKASSYTSEPPKGNWLAE
jgi:hypothetical protein